MKKLFLLCAFVATFTAGFGAGYVYNENLRFRMAASAAKSVAGTARTFLENSCEKDPDLKRCRLLPKKRQDAMD